MSLKIHWVSLSWHILNPSDFTELWRKAPAWCFWVCSGFCFSVDESLRTRLWTLTPARASSHKKGLILDVISSETPALSSRLVLISLPLCHRADAIFTSKEHVWHHYTSYVIIQRNAWRAEHAHVGTRVRWPIDMAEYAYEPRSEHILQC